MRQSDLLSAFTAIVGARNVLTGDSKSRYYRTGFRFGAGAAAAVVFPGTLSQQWQVLQVAVRNDCAIILQAAKTGLTGGSTPYGCDYDRNVIVVNVSRIKKIILLRGGEQAIVFPGTTLFELEQTLRPLGRVPHSVLGSTSIGATVIGGIANNAGGALCKRGSSYTELALYARVNAQRKLELIDHLGINNLGEAPEQKFARLEAGAIHDNDLAGWEMAASDRRYEDRIRDLSATVPNRYNADPKRLFELSGSAGKVAAFAARVDTYPAAARKQVFLLGTNNPAHFTEMRRHNLATARHLPEMVEYMNRTTFRTAELYGKDVALSIKYLGTKNLPKAYALKAKVENLLNKIPLLPKYLPDLFLHYVAKLLPNHLPSRLLEFRDRFEHYLIVVAADAAVDEFRQYLQDTWRSKREVEFAECNAAEQQAILLHRFSAAGAGIRYQNLHQRTTEQVLALDIALLGSDSQWTDQIPEEIADDVQLALYYGHFFCHVFHAVYLFRKGADLGRAKELMLKRLRAKGAKYPAEHNVGHLYQAEPSLVNFYEQLDPTNTFNPGIGKTKKTRFRSNLEHRKMHGD